MTIERDRQGRPTGIRGVIRDVTDQKVAEAALRESEERYRRLVELSPEAIVVQSEGKFVYVNPAAERLWGAAGPEELIGRSILDVVHPDYREIVETRIREVEELGSPKALNEQKHVKTGWRSHRCGSDRHAVRLPRPTGCPGSHSRHHRSTTWT